MRYGVSTSMKSTLSRYFRVSIPMRWRKNRLFCTGFRRKSKYRYCIRKSSPPSVSSSIVNGGVFAALSTSSDVTSISMSPVGTRLFLDSRSRTAPSTLITNSRPNLRACVQSSTLESMLKASWVNP